MAAAADGRFLLRIEDIDQSRARADWETQIYDDLRWLGLTWETPVQRQSENLPAYGAVLDQLWHRGYLYPCTCSRRDIQNALSAPQEGVAQFGPDGLIYPGTCRPDTTFPTPHQTPRPTDVTLRLALGDLADHQPRPYRFTETGAGPLGENGEIYFSATDLRDQVGDVVLARRDMGTSYHLSVVLDDAAQGVTHVIRGQDLFEATKIHVALQNLLGLPVPTYHHHGLIRDDAGKRLAKRDDARAISTYRADGASPADIRRLVGLT